MAHKLAEAWTCHIMPPLGGPGGVRREGTMDLSRMSAEGVLTDGRYYLEGGGAPRVLKGEARGVNPIFLTLREFDERNVHKATYDGLLVHESPNGRLVLVGRKHFETAGPNLELEAAGDQNDPPWVITKP